MADLISVFLFQFFFCCTFSESRVTPVIMVWLHTSIHKRTTCGDKFVWGITERNLPNWSRKCPTFVIISNRSNQCTQGFRKHYLYIIWHIINLYTCSCGYMNGLISYLPESEVAVTYGYTHSLHYIQIQLIFNLAVDSISIANIVPVYIEFLASETKVIVVVLCF